MIKKRKINIPIGVFFGEDEAAERRKRIKEALAAEKPLSVASHGETFVSDEKSDVVEEAIQVPIGKLALI